MRELGWNRFLRSRISNKWYGTCHSALYTYLCAASKRVYLWWDRSWCNKKGTVHMQVTPSDSHCSQGLVREVNHSGSTQDELWCQHQILFRDTQTNITQLFLNPHIVDIDTGADMTISLDEMDSRWKTPQGRGAVGLLSLKLHST